MLPPNRQSDLSDSTKLPTLGGKSPALSKSKTHPNQDEKPQFKQEPSAPTTELSAEVEWGASEQSVTGDTADSFDYRSEVNKLPVNEHFAVRPDGGRDGSADTSRSQTQSQIRETIARTLHLDGRYGSAVASAIALACHPWPDESIDESIRGAIAAELLPGLNINHPSLLEIASDRLLRIADALIWAGAEATAFRFTIAAKSLTHSVDCDVFAKHMPQQDTITSPWGLTTPFASQLDRLPVDDVPRDDDSEEGRRWRILVHGLIGGVGIHESHDVGVICGGSPADVTVDELAAKLNVEMPEIEFEEFLNCIDSRKLDILRSRTYKLRDPETLKKVATRWNVTRERVRQIETATNRELSQKFADVLKEVGCRALSPFQNRVVKVSVLHRVALVIAEKCQYQEPLAAFLLKLFGPWNICGEWAVHHFITKRVESLHNKLASEADHHGILDAERVVTLCEPLFLGVEERNQYLSEVVGVGYSFGNWTIKQTLRCEVLSALKRIGRPATKEELADLTGHSLQQVSSVLGCGVDIVRADRHRWGFSEWIDDEYTGVADEINQQIEEHHGSVSVEFLVAELQDKFGVTENSIRSTLSSEAFFTEYGYARKATASDYRVRDDPERVKGAVSTINGWGQLIKLSDYPFSGYSLGVSFDLAYANGIRPHDHLLVNIEGTEHQGSIIWRPTSASRRVDIGRLANALRELGFVPGDEVLAIPLPDRIVLSRTVDVEITEDVDEEDELIFGDNDCHELLSDVIPKHKEL